MTEDELLQIIADLTDAEDCRLDHDGCCQTHDWFGDTPCPHARAKEALGPDWYERYRWIGGER